MILKELILQGARGSTESQVLLRAWLFYSGFWVMNFISVVELFKID